MIDFFIGFFMTIGIVFVLLMAFLGFVVFGLGLSNAITRKRIENYKQRVR